MNLSIIIPAYRELQDVLTCLNSLQATATDFRTIQWIVQDDCSPNVDFRAVIPPYMASVERNEVNKGFAGNCNAGAARATGDILVFCNQDIQANELSRGWDQALLVPFMAEYDAGIVGGRLLFPDGKVQSVGGEFDAHCQPHHRCIGYSDLTYWEVSQRRQVAWTTGAFLAIRRDVFEKVGGFDERYAGGYFEDVALCLRARELGFTVWYEPTVTFTHKVGTSGGNPNFMRNAALFKREWVDTRKITPDVPVILERWW